MAATAACVFATKLSFLDETGRIVATDQFPACRNYDSSQAAFHASLVFAGMGSGLPEYDRFFYGYGDEKRTTGFFNQYYSLLVGERKHEPPEALYLIAPMFFNVANFSITPNKYVPTLIFIRDIQLSVDELKAVHSVKCELMFDGELPPSLGHEGATTEN